MKKTLIALAAVAVSSAAFAQSSVSITGLLDIAYSNTSGTQAQAKGDTFATTTGTSATSGIRFTVNEDLGGGMRATVQYDLDPRALVNDAGAIGRNETFLALSGNFGRVALGSPNGLGLVVHGISSPLGTGVGSGYNLTNLWTPTRYSRSIRYDSPSFSGVTVHALYAPGNDTVAPGSSTLVFPNAREATEFAAIYRGGPLTVGFAHIRQGSFENSATTDKTSSNTITASYSFGDTSVHAGWNRGELTGLFNGAAAVDTKGYRLAVRHNMGAISLMAQYTVQENDGLVAVDGKHRVVGFRADYNLSKRTAAYFGIDRYKSDNAYNTASAAVASFSGTRNTVSVGVRHSF